MGFRYNISRFLLLLSLPAIILLYYNQSANWHYHVLGNGIVVEHAHPFSSKTVPGTPYQQHHHSDFEYSVLAGFSNILTLVVAIMAIAGVHFSRKIKSEIKPVKSFIPSQRFNLTLLRAPPSAF